MGTIVLIVTIVLTIIVGRFAISKGQALERRKQSLKRNHDLHYNSLDTNSEYSQRECCGQDCGCHTEEKKVDMKSSGDM